MTIHKRLPVFLLTVLLTGATALAAHAQMARAVSAADADHEWAALLTTYTNTTPATLAARDFEAMTKQQWKALRKETLQALGSNETWEAAAQRVIYLSTHFGDKVNFNRASVSLYETYALDRDEQRRILALAGLYAVGHEDTMRHVAQRVRLERSPRVRRLTQAALRAHYAQGFDTAARDKQAAIDRYVADPRLSEHILLFEAGLPGYQLHAEDMLAEGDKVAVRCRVVGKHAGPLFGVPAPGERIEVPLIIIYQIEGGKIVNHWMQADTLGLMQQIGAVPMHHPMM